MKQIKQFKIYEIGEIQDNSRIVLKKEFIKALKQLDLFSHMIVIFSNKLIQNTVEIKKIDQKKGVITFEGNEIIENKTKLYDIKPYFPCEDRVKESVVPDWLYQKKYESFFDNNTINENKVINENQIESVGVLKKINGDDFIYIFRDFDNQLNLLEGCSHIKLMWWFSRFDDSKYRKITTCNPPYENAPVTGVFASRSPVRPNPIALTTARILEIDKELRRIKVSKLDSFDNTPLIKIIPYISIIDKVEYFSVPKWLKHWPMWFEEACQDESSKVLLKASNRDLIEKYKPLNVKNKQRNFYEKPKTLETASDKIIIKSASHNNLKEIDVSIPHNKITAVTGVSGSGKSSLVFDTIYEESQRRYMHSMGVPQVRSKEKPNFESISGLPPAILISQKNITTNPRSTVGTITDIYDYLRSIFANIGIKHCPKCGGAIIPMSSEEIYENLLELPDLTKLEISPYKNNSFSYVHIIGESSFKTSEKSGLLEAIEQSLEQGEGAIEVSINDEDYIVFQKNQMCHECSYIMFDLTSASFSYNNPDSMCVNCNGTGVNKEPDYNKIISASEKSILDGASNLWGNLRKFKENPNANWSKGEVIALAESLNVDLEKPWNELPKQFKEKLLWGTDEEVTYNYKNKNGRSGKITRKVEGAFNYIERLQQNGSSTEHKIADEFMKESKCTRCDGERLSDEGRLVSILGMRYPEVAAMSIEALKLWILNISEKLGESEYNKIEISLGKLYRRLELYIDMGLNYLELNRSITTLSGGELQRIKIVNQLNREAANMLYILDEPSSGLHSKDYSKLIDIIKMIKSSGNTVIVVDHNKDIIKSADYFVDMGKGAGIHGGDIVAKGSILDIMENVDSDTGRYLSGKKAVFIENNEIQNDWVEIKGAKENNLKNIDIKFPLYGITCITGVSGSGKSTLVSKVIYPYLKHKTQVIYVNQKPIGRSTRSNIATYTGIMDEIKRIFAVIEEAKSLGLKENAFSFNSREGCCDKCKGEGRIVTKISYLEDIWNVCPLCRGKRYKKSILEIWYKGKNIDEVMNMSVEECLEFFSDKAKILSILNILSDAGLGYVKLGQSTTELSGGEAQRLKLSKALCLNKTNGCMYFLDEPTTGLHFSDVQNLLNLFDKIRKVGNTIVIIEHNIDIIKNADWIIDLGPEGGELGGNLLAQGTVKDIMKSEDSYTAKALKLNLTINS